jgi:hypothetical protein
MSSNIYCYHCHVQHSRDEMRLVITKTGKRWRCERSIKSAQGNKEARDAFGRRITANNKAETQASIRMRSKD